MAKQTIAEFKASVTASVGKDKVKLEATALGKNIPDLTKEDYTNILEKYKAPEMTREEISIESDKFNNSRNMYIVTDHDNSFSLEEDVNGRVFKFSYANKVISKTGTVRLDGEPQYLSKATVRHLETIQCASTAKKLGSDEPDTKLGNPRFKITPTEGLTEDQIAALVAKQKANK